LTGPEYNHQYERAALEADLPRIEAGCDRTSGAGCTLIPTTDAGTPAAFYPYFSIARSHSERDRYVGYDGHGGNGGGCVWQFGATPPGTTNDFGKNAGYGSLLSSTYLKFGGLGATQQLINNYRNVFSTNPCPAPNEDQQH